MRARVCACVRVLVSRYVKGVCIKSICKYVCSVQVRACGCALAVWRRHTHGRRYMLLSTKTRRANERRKRARCCADVLLTSNDCVIYGQ